MAIVKFAPAGSPLNNIFDYVMRDEVTEDKLISGVNCSPESALDEFRFVKKRFHKEDGRSYYHIVQSFSPDDDLTPEMAHEIGLKFADYFPGFQIVVATHVNTNAIQDEFCQGYFLPNLLLFFFAIQPKADDAFYAKVKSAFLADDNMWSVYYEWFCLRVTESHPRKHRQGYLM